LWCGSRRYFEKKIPGGDPMIKDIAFTVYPVRDSLQVRRLYGLEKYVKDALLADAVFLVSRGRKK
jgi:hypothetical protein